MNARLPAVAAVLFLAGCASQKQTPAEVANQAACTQQANAMYQNSTVNLQARTAQTGLRYGGPNQVFDAERMGAMNDRALQIQRCEQIGNQNGSPTVNGVPVVTPHIVN
ncbi:hypothetical protein [Acidocella aminolytica]|nr:hypothetical protein [Acidocella aminolytica]SHE84518.1 hypothetical protein SAMN02746095_01378 [Acidocella aminolytica 101 = DSM 11237]